MGPRSRLLVHDLRRGKRLIRWSLAGFALVFVGGLIVVAGFYFISGAHKGATPSAMDARIPTANYTAGAIDIFGCLATGESCAGYAEAKTYAARLAPGEFSYTPMSPDDPGSAGPQNMKVVSLSKLTDQQLQAVGNAVVRDGGIDSGDIVPESVTEVGSHTGTYEVPGSSGSAAVMGTMTFAANPETEDVSLSSVSYTEGG